MNKTLISGIAALFTATLLLLPVTPAHAQQVPSNELSLSAGYVTEASAVYTLAGLFGTIFSGGFAVPDKMQSTGAYGIEYFRYVHPHVAVGGLMTLEAFNLQFKSYSGKDEAGNRTYTLGKPSWSVNMSVLPAVKFPWFHREHCSMYSKVALGLWLVMNPAHTETDSDGNESVTPASVQPSFAFQVSGVGVDFGGDRFRGFAEAGFGCQGLVMLGGRYRF